MFFAPKAMGMYTVLEEHWPVFRHKKKGSSEDTRGGETGGGGTLHEGHPTQKGVLDRP